MLEGPFMVHGSCWYPPKTVTKVGYVELSMFAKIKVVTIFFGLKFNGQ